MFLEISQNSQKSICARVSLLNKVTEACNFIKKETLSQRFSCKFCEIYKNTFFYRTPLDECFCNKLNIISCGICLSFKSRHLELLYKIMIQLLSTGIFLVLWSKGPSCNFTKQLFFLHSCEWLVPVILLLSLIKKQVLN